MPPMTPEEQLALLNFLGMGAYGSPLMESPASQLNLIQDIGSMAFDTVFMYNMGLITPEQLLSSIESAMREPVGDASDYDWQSTYDSIVASGETELIDGANAIRSGSQTAAQFIRGLRSRMAEEGAYELNPALDSIIDSLEQQLQDFETKYNNYNFVQQKIDAGEYQFDQATNMIYKPVLGEQARENLRAAGWKGPFQEPEFWRTIPDVETMNQAAKLQEQFSPLFEAYDKDQELVSRGTREELAKKSPAMKKLLELKPETAQQGEYTTRGWKAIEDAYNKALNEFKAKYSSPSTEKPTYKATVKYVTPGTPNAYGVPSRGGVTVGYTRNPTQSQANTDYWAKQAAYYTAKGMGAQRDTQAKQVKEAEGKVQAKVTEAQQKGTVPALEWLKMMPQLAAMAAQPAPEAPKPRYVKPQPRTLSDQEIEIMANMIAGGMG